MARSRAKATGRRESGSYVALPHAVLRHPNFASLSPRATKLLMDLCSVYNGQNNGDMATAWTIMRHRGWRSRDQLFKAQKELLEKAFIVKTRQGGRNRCNLFAITFWSIDECNGKLDISGTISPPGDWKKSISVTRTAGHVDTLSGLEHLANEFSHGHLTRDESESVRRDPAR